MGRRRSGDDAALLLVVGAAIALVVGIFKLIAVIFEGTQSNDKAKQSRALAAGAALVVLVAIGVVVANNAGDGTSQADNTNSAYQSPISSPPPPDPGAESLAGARYC